MYDEGTKPTLDYNSEVFSDDDFEDPFILLKDEDLLGNQLYKYHEDKLLQRTNNVAILKKPITRNEQQH